MSGKLDRDVKAEALKCFSPGEAANRRDIGKDTAADNNAEMLRTAQRIAVELGASGVVTMDSVTYEMVKQGYPVAPKRGKGRQNWKGSVFPASKWVKAGDTVAVLATSHGRHQTQWVLKEWLKSNSLNGCNSSASAFNLLRIYREYAKKHGHEGKVDLTSNARWYIAGTIEPDMNARIEKDNHLFGIPVSRIADGCGAILLPEQRKD
jgi:hypothetical protein